MITAGLLLFGIAGMAGLGVGVVRLLIRTWGRSATWSIAEVCGAGLVLGIGLTSWLQLVWCLAGGRLGSGLSLSLACVGVIVGTGSAMGMIGGAPKVLGSALISGCRGMVALLWCLVLVQAVLTPQRLWDERAIFGIKGATLFEDRTIASERLRDPDVVQGHPRYPLLLPLAEAHVYFLLGRVDDRWAKLVPPLLWLGLLLAFAGVTSRHVGPSRGWLCTLLLASVPALFAWDYGFITAQADAPLACFHGLSALYLWDHLAMPRDRAAPLRLLLAGIAAGLALFTKDEGIALLLIDAGSLIVLTGATALRTTSWRRLPVSAESGHRTSDAGSVGHAGGHETASRLVAQSAAFLTPVLAIVVPWLWHRRSLPETNEMTYFARLNAESLKGGLATVGWSVRHLLQRMFLEAYEWGLPWWGVVISAGLNPRRVLTWPQLFLLLDICGALAALVVAGMLAPIPVQDHLGGSAHRFLLQITPVAVLFFAGQWSRVERDAADARGSLRP